MPRANGSYAYFQNVETTEIVLMMLNSYKHGLNN